MGVYNIRVQKQTEKSMKNTTGTSKDIPANYIACTHPALVDLKLKTGTPLNALCLEQSVSPSVFCSQESKHCGKSDVLPYESVFTINKACTH